MVDARAEVEAAAAAIEITRTDVDTDEAVAVELALIHSHWATAAAYRALGGEDSQTWQHGARVRISSGCDSEGRPSANCRPRFLQRSTFESYPTIMRTETPSLEPAEDFTAVANRIQESWNAECAKPFPSFEV